MVLLLAADIAVETQLHGYLLIWRQFFSILPPTPSSLLPPTCCHQPCLAFCQREIKLRSWMEAAILNCALSWRQQVHQCKLDAVSAAMEQKHTLTPAARETLYIYYTAEFHHLQLQPSQNRGGGRFQLTSSLFLSQDCCCRQWMTAGSD